MSTAVRPYLQQTYAYVLAALGTSVDELTAVRQHPQEAPVLAQRLGVPVDLLTQLLLGAGGATALSEEELERMFGVVSTDVTSRNPLSSGPVTSTPSTTRVMHWELSNAAWIAGADSQGQLYGFLQLAPDGTTRVQLSLAATVATPATIVAQGILTPSPNNPNRRSGQLQPYGESGVAGSLVLEMTDFSLEAHASTRLTFTVFPHLTASRLSHLESQWRAQDTNRRQSLSDWNGLGFIIDPDVIGPDDIRPAAATGMPSAAYMLWQKRLQFLQDVYVDSDPSVRSLIAGLPTQFVEYRGLTNSFTRVAWPATVSGSTTTDGLALLEEMALGLESTNALTRELTTKQVNRLGLTTALLLRLRQLLRKEQQGGSSDADVKEALVIAQASLKAAFAPDWAAEEQAQRIELSGVFFQTALHEPVEGEWAHSLVAQAAPASLPQVPLVDPDTITPLHLPDAGFGDAAHQLWHRRRTEVESKIQQLLIVPPAATPLERADAMLRQAYVEANSLGVRYMQPEDAAGAYANALTPEHAQAVHYVEQELALMPSEFARLLALREVLRREQSASEAIWRELAALLAQGWKRAVAYSRTYSFGDPAKSYPGWIAEENQLRDTLVAAYRNALSASGQNPAHLEVDALATLFYKQRLQAGRALPALRAKWASALELAFQRPLIDPDQALPSDFRQAALKESENATQYFNLAYQFFAQRTAEVRTWAEQVNISWAGVESVLRVPRATVEQLYADLEDGGEIDTYLRRLNLTVDGLRMLIGHLNNGTTEAGEVRDLLTQVLRERHYATWSREEIAKGMSNSPRYFREPSETEPFIWQELSEGGRYFHEPTPGLEETSHLPWRTSAADRAEWRQQLQARYTQVRELVAGWEQVLHDVEETTMPVLRDALINHYITAPEAGTTLAQKRRYLADKYYLDFSLSCCQYTTRVGQAIEVLQKLFFEHRHGLLNPVTNLRLTSVGDKFDQDWQWLSTFERWRSLMFLYLYPENMLLPTLKPRQTSLFQQVIQETRQQSSLTPTKITEYFTRYEEFLEGTKALTLGASLHTTSVLPTGTGGGVTAPEEVSIQFALSDSQQLYYNLAPIDDTNAPANWRKIAIKPNVRVTRIVGARAYKNDAGERHAYVFVLMDEEMQTASGNYTTHGLFMQRLNLSTLIWNSGFTQMSWFRSYTGEEDENLCVVQERNETKAPRITYLQTNGSGNTSYAWGGRSGDISSALNQTFRGYYLYYVDLNPAGTGCLASSGGLPINWVNDLKLLSCVGASGTSYNDEIQYSFALKIGLDSNAYKFVVYRCNVYTFNNPFSSSFLGLIDRRIQDRDSDNNYVHLGPDIPDEVEVYPGFTAPATSTTSFQEPTEGDDGGGGGPQYEYTNAYYARQYIQDQINRYTSEQFTNLHYKTATGDTTPDLLLGSDPHKVVGLRATAIGGTGLFPTGQDTFDLFLRETQGTAVVTKRIPFSLGVYDSSTGQQLEPYFGAPTGEQTAPAPLPLPAAHNYLHIGSTFHSTDVALTGDKLPVLVYQVQRANSGFLEIHLGSTTTSTQDRILHVGVGALPALLPAMTTENLKTRRNLLQNLGLSSSDSADSINYLREAYYMLPMYVATELQRNRNYEEALHYFRLVYDFTQIALTDASQRLIYPELMPGSGPNFSDQDVISWLSDPTNPHALAALRPGTMLRYVVTSIVRCLLAYADEEFARDSVESVGRARSLYELAQRLLETDVPAATADACQVALDSVDSLVSLPWQAEWETMKAALSRISRRTTLDELLHRATVPDMSGRGIVGIFQASGWSWEVRFRSVWALINTRASQLIGSYDTLCQAETTPAQLSETLTSQQLQRIVSSGALDEAVTLPYIPIKGASFCVPPNSLPTSLRLHAELNLAKISSCRNIAGVQRELELYSGVENADPYVGGGRDGLMPRPSRIVVPATQYRYSYLLERTKQLISLAQQAEGALLSALEKRDAEEYNLLKARQDIGVSRATVRLQDLRTVEASNGIGLANLQLQRSQAMEQQYSQWISAGLNGYERKSMKNMVKARKINKVSGFIKSALAFGSGGLLGVISGVGDTLAADANAKAQEQQTYATYERRNDEWKLQRNLAQKDIAIGNQQIILAQDRLQISNQEKVISELQLDNAEAVLNFLTTKFTNAELYDWMSQILEAAYGYFLQQATATARLAEQQLAFERQELSVGVIQQDYWSAPTSGSGTPDTTDRKGMTGSVRLLQDLTRLDQYAFETNRRKLQLTKTVSLSQLFPAEFAQFRETGVLPFALLQRNFDQDFPGHYLRTIRRVRTSVVALVPPTEGIKAKLSATGISRVVVSGSQFQTVTLIRQPEAVALTAPINASGLFELEQQPGELLYPFEGMGVDSSWTFSLQKAANPFDFDSIADVLITLEYTAYESGEYAQQVRQQLGTRRQQVIALSLRDQFADQWYDLHHPQEVADGEQYTARITLTQADLPVHLRNARISALSLYVDVADEVVADRGALGLRLARGGENEPGTTLLTNRYGLISTRSGVGRNGSLYNGNAVALLPQLGRSPLGEWVLSLDDAPQNRLRQLLQEGKVDDLYLLLEVEGEVPAYQLT
ncbi:Tc toxin subunit A-related protein [Hymenobacter glacieicola]|uniref:Tc toxin subunit A-related protein n=1 Tax=Hymenobacter glacieicola TaxID=1562124 RepID=UPI0016659575|nr:neuraminidase-like domain-containing protein [Hymenobacter glacieicola]